MDYNEILFYNLTQLWYEYISLDHHKDRDCHWNLAVDWAYGKPPQFVAEHHGYVGDSQTVFCNSYHEAIDSLLEMIKESMAKEFKWAQSVLLSKSDWDDEQIAQAEFAKKNFNEDNLKMLTERSSE